MFRKIAITFIGIFISTAAFAHDDWQHRHHHRHHHDHRHHYRQQGYDPFYRAYMPAPVAGYYMTPNQYYVPHSIAYFEQYRDQPRRCEEREDW